MKNEVYEFSAMSLRDTMKFEAMLCLKDEGFEVNLAEKVTSTSRLADIATVMTTVADERISCTILDNPERPPECTEADLDELVARFYAVMDLFRTRHVRINLRKDMKWKLVKRNG